MARENNQKGINVEDGMMLMYHPLIRYRVSRE